MNPFILTADKNWFSKTMPAIHLHLSIRNDCISDFSQFVDSNASLIIRGGLIEIFPYSVVLTLSWVFLRIWFRMFYIVNHSFLDTILPYKDCFSQRLPFIPEGVINNILLWKNYLCYTVKQYNISDFLYNFHVLHQLIIYLVPPYEWFECLDWRNLLSFI